MFQRKKKEESEKQPKESKKTSKKLLRQRRNAQNAIVYEKMLRNGICVLPNNLYSASMRFKDINYGIATEEEQTSIFGRYMDLLNALGQEYGLQLTIHNRKIDEEEFGRNAFMDLTGDSNDRFRIEFNKVMKSNISRGNNRIISDKMMTYTIREDSYEDAEKSLRILNDEFRKKFKNLKCDTELMNGYDRLETIYSIINPDSRFYFSYDQLDRTFTTKDAITPDYFDFKTDGHHSFRINGRYAKVLYLKTWATELKDDLIKDLSMIEHNLTVSFHMKIIPRGDDLSMVKNQIAKMEMQKIDEQKKALRYGYDPEMLPMELQYSLEEAYVLKNDVEKRNQRLFECQFLVFINSETKEEFDATEKAVMTVCKKQSCEMGSLAYRQEDGFNAILPIGYAVKNLARTLPTSVCAIIIPFTSQELMQKGNCFFYGVNSVTSNMIMADRTKLANTSGWILGFPGSGKSFAAKSEMTQAFLRTKDDIIVLDPQSEYVALANEYGGSVVNVDTRSGVHINAFAGDIYEKDFIKEKGDFAQVIAAEMIGEGKLSPEQKSLVDIAVRNMYKEYESRLLDKSNGIRPLMPCLDDLYRHLKQMEEPEARKMALSMGMYITGGTYDLLSGQSNVDLDNRFTIYNIYGLSEILRPLAMKVVLEFLKEKIQTNFKKGIRTRVYVDEFYLMLKDEYSQNFFFEFWRWARKFGADPTGITQNIEVLLKSPEMRTLLSNSEFMLLMNQAPSDREEVQQLFGLSEDQMEAISNGESGSGLIRFGNTIIPFVNNFPRNTELYRIWDTTFKNKQNEAG